MSLLYGSSLGYSGSTPEPSHCPECERCRERIVGHCRLLECEAETPEQNCTCRCQTCLHSDLPLCTEPEEHQLCGPHKAEAEQARAEYLWEDR